MLRFIRSFLCLAAVSILAACGGGVEVDSNGNFVFSAYVTIAPVVVTTPVSYPPMHTFPQSCIVRNPDGTYTLYGYGYAGCPQLFGYDLVTLFQASFPQVYVDSWFYPGYGTVHISIR